MAFQDYLDIAPQVQEALDNNIPVVGLESTILSHGFPYPENKNFARKVEEIVRAEGAVPATTAVIGGRLKLGLTEDELEFMCNPKDVAKISRRDIAAFVATGRPGATTVASTMMICAMGGVKVFATGGIGGVHRGGEHSMDISADLPELQQTPVAVICAGAKQLLDIGRTLEVLETYGVPVLGYGTDQFPAFYCRESGFGVDMQVNGPEETAKIIKTKWDLGLRGGLLICNPIPAEYALDFSTMEAVISGAIAEAEAAGIHGKYITPFLLAAINRKTERVSYESNLQLAYNNARVAASISRELTRLG